MALERDTQRRNAVRHGRCHRDGDRGPTHRMGPPLHGGDRARRRRHRRHGAGHVSTTKLTCVYGRAGMPYEDIDGLPVWYEELGDPAGPPLVALHGGILTFHRSFDDVLPWLTDGRRVIGIELQGHGHTPDTGRDMSIDRFADDVAEMIDRLAGGAPVDVWGF